MIINKNWKLESDTLNVTLFYKKDGTKTWRPMYYLSNPQNAMDALIEHEIMGTGMKDLKTVVEKINELYALVRTLKGLPDLLESAPRPAKRKSGGKSINGEGAIVQKQQKFLGIKKSKKGVTKWVYGSG